MKSPLTTFLLIDKPAGWTSFDVCAKLRKPLGVKRIGHTGTLDPFATGLLVVAVGKCTKLIPLLEKDKKTYQTKILLGKTSDTLDPESEIVDCRVPNDEWERTQQMTKTELQAWLHQNFLGKIEQIPPQYSALKINGQRAYALAREGQRVEMKPRSTEVFKCEVLSYNFPELEVELTVAAGFYVRSFARDVGTALAGGGMCAELRRVGVGALNLESGDLSVVTDLDQVSEKDFVDPQIMIKNVIHINIATERLPDLQAGRAVFAENLPNNGEKVLVLCDGHTVGLAEVKEGNLQPRVVF